MAAKTERKPMTFNVAPDPAPAEAAPRPVATRENAAKVTSINPPAKTPDAAERQQVGARVTKATYRQLKAKAALSGSTVQALVEQAIDEFLAKTTS